MTQEELRKYMLHLTNGGEIEAIMLTIKQYVAEVIGEDEKLPAEAWKAKERKRGGHDVVAEAVYSAVAINTEKAEQRKRAGL